MIQSGNWRGARDPARELEGARDAGNSRGVPRGGGGAMEAVAAPFLKC